MTYCKEYLDAVKKIPNFCGISSNQRERLLKYDALVDHISEKYGIPEDTVHNNVSFNSTTELIRFPKNNDIRKRVEERIASTLKSGNAVTKGIVDHWIGLEPAVKKAKTKKPTITCELATARDAFTLSDKIRTILSVLTVGQKKLLTDIMVERELDNEYAALSDLFTLWNGEKEVEAIRIA